MIIIDWLSIYQDIPDGHNYPLLRSEIKLTICALTGEQLLEQTKGYQHTGSYDSSILIKFDGHRLMMSGNPSKFNRIDNLFGVRTVNDAVNFYNAILQGLGYPVFMDFNDEYETPTKKPSAQYRSALKTIQDRSAVITRVDITENFQSSIPVYEALRYLSTFEHRGEPGFLYPNGKTVDWMGSRGGNENGSKRLYFKYYDKAHDVYKTYKKLTNRLKRFYLTFDKKSKTVDIKKLQELKKLETDEKYLSKLIEYLNDKNVIRFELELKSKYLEEKGLNRIKNWSYDAMIIQLSKYKLHEKQTKQFTGNANFYQEFIKIGLTPRQATTLAPLANLWYSGQDIHFARYEGIKQRTFYNLRKQMLRIGFNISNPINVASYPTNVKTVMFSSLEIPEFYKDVG